MHQNHWIICWISGMFFITVIVVSAFLYNHSENVLMVDAIKAGADPIEVVSMFETVDNDTLILHNLSKGGK